MPPVIDVPDITRMIGRLIYGQTPEQREELTQGAWLAVLQAAAAYDQHPEWGTWFGTAKRVAWWSIKNTLKRKRPGLFSEDQEEMLPGRREAPAGDNLDAESLLDRLDAEDYELVSLRFHGGHTYGEIGQRAGISESGARQRVHRALQQMRHRR